MEGEGERGRRKGGREEERMKEGERVEMFVFF